MLSVIGRSSANVRRSPFIEYDRDGNVTFRTPTVFLLSHTANPASFVGEGTWRVGKEMTPGAWTPDGGTACTWVRLADFLGTPSSIITQGTASPGQTVNVTPNDAGFLVQGCSWHVA